MPLRAAPESRLPDGVAVGLLLLGGGTDVMVVPDAGGLDGGLLAGADPVPDARDVVHRPAPAALAFGPRAPVDG